MYTKSYKIINSNVHFVYNVVGRKTLLLTFYDSIQSQLRGWNNNTFNINLYVIDISLS